MSRQRRRDRFPALPLFVDDYEGATAHLSLEEDGAYSRLLRLMWRAPQCRLPNDANWIRRKMRVDQETYDRVVVPLIEEFCQSTGNYITQARLSDEFDYVRSKVNNARKNRRTRDTESGKPLENKELEQQLNPSETEARSDTQPNPTQPKEEAVASSLPRLHFDDDLAVSNDVLRGWLAHRKAVKAPVGTQLVMTRASNDLRELRDQHGIDPNEALLICMDRGWRGIPADGVLRWAKSGGPPPATSHREMSESDRMLARLAAEKGQVH